MQPDQHNDPGDEREPEKETQEPKTKLLLAIRLQNERPEYVDKARRVIKALSDRLEKDEELRKAFRYLAADTPFALMVAPAQPKQIIIPSAKLPGRVN